MIKTSFFAITLFLSSMHVFAQSTSTKFEDTQTALATYYYCIKEYSIKHSSANFTPTEIASAALSECQEFHSKYINLSIEFLKNSNRADELGEIAKENAKNFAIKTVIETKVDKKK